MEPKLKEKTWSKELEKPIYERWKRENAYVFKETKGKNVFSIDTPPPYVNTPVHIGQVTTYVLMDMFARFKRMAGSSVLFPLGLDRNGLPIEMAAEKRFKVKLTDLSREKAIQYCEKILEEASLASVESFLRCGISFNSWKKGAEIGEVYETDSPEYRQLTQETFIDLWNKGLIYEAERVNNYCPGCQTTLADAEVIYENIPGNFYEIKFRCKETGEDLIIGTTRPELICSVGMVVFNPQDKGYKKLEGKTAVAPFYDKEVPIKADPSAQMGKGTGLVMMCSFGDLTDIRFFRDNQLTPTIAIDRSGKMNEHAGFLSGIPVKEARKRIVERLREEGLLVRAVPTQEHRTPICERSKDPIEFIAMSELYLKQVSYKKEMLKLAAKLKFYSPQSRQILIDWINTVSIDWPISRRRFYATEVPLWYCKKCSMPFVPPKGRYYTPWKQKPPVKECPQCGNKEFVGETRVFDTWFDSSITPLYILGYGRNQKFFSEHHPCSLRPQGKEIVRTWLYYTLLKDYLLTGTCIFKEVWINYHIVDEKGYKMSKSKGNVIDPKDVLDRYGAEAFRMWATIEGNLEQTDFRCSFDRIEGAGKTVTKLWNVARFISMFPKPEGRVNLREVDRWILQEIQLLAKETRKSYEDYDFHNPSIKIKHFLWETFASHYLEMVKNRAYNQEGGYSGEEQNGALSALHTCLGILLKLWAPVIPMVTAKIYEVLEGKDIHKEAFPEIAKETQTELKTEDITRVNSMVWKAKKDAGVSLKAEVARLTIPKSLESIKEDLKAMHNVKNINEGEISVEI